MKKITIRIPKRWKGDDERFLSCNGKRVMVKTGIDVDVSPAIAEVYFNSVRQRDESEEHIARLADPS